MHKHPKTARRTWLDNLFWFLGCLGLAFVVWMVATLQGDPIEQWRLAERVPIHSVPDSGLIITNGDTLTTTATVYLRGPQSARPLITANDVTVTANLAGLPPGIHTVPLTAEVAGNDARVENISPSQITVALELVAAQYVPLRVDITEPPPPDVEIVNIAYDALQAEISGPESQVSQVVAASAPVDLSEQRAVYETDIRLLPVDADGAVVSDVTIMPANTLVTVTMQQSESVRELSIRPQLVGELPEGYFLTSIEYAPQIIYVSLPSDAPDDLPDSAFTAPIDLSDRTGDFTVVVPVELPIADAVPISEANIAVSIGVSAQTVTRQFDNVPLEIIGRRQGFEYRLDPSDINVILTGPQPLLDALSPTDIRVTVDVSDLSASGSYRLPVQTLNEQASETVSATMLPAEVSVQVTTSAEVTDSPSGTTPTAQATPR